MTEELWLVDEKGDTLLLIEDEDRKLCPVDRVPLDDEGECAECGLNWIVFS